MEYLLAAVMGAIEGLTEFLPVSSTGHLILAGKLLGFDTLVGEDVADTFEIFIQLGAILAVVAAYPARFIGLLRPDRPQAFSGLRGIGLLIATTIPASLLGLVCHRFIKTHLFSTSTVAIGLAVGAVWIIAVELARPIPKRVGLDEVTWKDALAVGLFQCLALWPGMSRAGSTIPGGMVCGLERKTATEYSFFAAVPIMVAATLYDLYKSRDHLQATHFTLFAIGFVASFIFAWLAVKLFIRFLSRHTLTPFGWYRLALAAVVVAILLRG
jgi:undecaprenyl-diphosphatase